MHEYLKELFSWICSQSDHAPYFLFILLLLSGLSLPVSEDLIIIAGGLLAAHCVDSETFPYFFFFMLLLGSLLSAWIAYWIGRLLGPKFFNLPMINHFIKPKHLRKATILIKKFGIYSFLIGRFFPGGVRNSLFMTSGLTKMPFPIFILRDLIAGTLTTTVLFTIGYVFGQNLDQIFSSVGKVDQIGLVFSLFLIGIVFFRRKIPKQLK